MSRLDRLLPAAMAVLAVAQAAAAQPAASHLPAATVITAHATTHGSLSGIVSDDRGAPLEGVMVSATGATIAFAVTDAGGKYLFEALPSGSYLLRAHISGFVAARREVVDVHPSAGTVRLIQLRREGEPAAAAVATRPILVAGTSLSGGSSQARELGEQPVEATPSGTPGTHPHSEQAWRLRHLRRSVLRDATGTTIVAGASAADFEPDADAGALFSRALESSARLAASLFTEFPFTGELNLLTTGAFDRAGELFRGQRTPRGVAYLAIGAPAGAGDWTVRAAVTQGDISSWILAGSYVAHTAHAHAFDVGMSYGAQEYQGGNPAALAVASDGRRHVGAIYAFDDWTITRRVRLSYGGRLSYYDYIDRDGLFNPRIGVSVMAAEGTWVRASVSQRQLAPGAEEFLPPPAQAMWLPPERTFAPIARLTAGAGSSQRGIGAAGLGDDEFRVERARHVELSVEREFDDAYVVGVRRFYQEVDDQLATLFGLRADDRPRSELGHYFVATAGGFDADGWGVRLASPTARRLRGSIDYTVTRARWSSTRDEAAIERWAPAVRRDREEIHDVTTAFETDIPETSTRVHVIYKVNSAYTRSEIRWTGAPGGDVVLDRPGLGTRFDVQVNQALPFLPFGSQWEVLVGVRNLFREPGGAASIYDELLVVRPPKRLVGGVQVKF